MGLITLFTAEEQQEKTREQDVRQFFKNCEKSAKTCAMIWAKKPLKVTTLVVLFGVVIVLRGEKVTIGLFLSHIINFIAELWADRKVINGWSGKKGKEV